MKKLTLIGGLSHEKKVFKCFFDYVDAIRLL